MISLQAVIALMFIHWFADFVLQTRWMALNKSSKNQALLIHVFVYSLPFLVFGSLLFVVVNFFLHLVIDWCSSRVNSKMWAKNNMHGFFVSVGLDQTLHVISLVATYIWIFG